MRRLVQLLLLLLAFGASVALGQETCPNPQPNAKCQVGPCTCISFVATLVSTDTNSPKTTTVALNITNQCNSGVTGISINYGSDAGQSNGLTLISPLFLSGQYKGPDYGSAHLSPVAGAYTIKQSGTTLNFVPYNNANTGGPWNTETNFQNGAWDVLVFRFQSWTNGYAFPSLSATLANGGGDTYTNVNFAGCPCSNCDYGNGNRVVKSCTISSAEGGGGVTGYPKTYVQFVEPETYAASAIVGNELQVFWTDEWSATLGVYQSVVTDSTGTTTYVEYPFSNFTGGYPYCVENVQVGTTAITGTNAGVDDISCSNTAQCCGTPTYFCARPMFPSLFITDLTVNGASSTAGDWQYQNVTNYQFYVPNRVCGVWRGATKTINTGTGVYSVLPTNPVSPNALCNSQTDYPPSSSTCQVPSNNYNFGAGSSPLPYAVANYNVYGAMAVWYLSDLPLDAGHTYRFQYIVHDGDQTHGGVSTPGDSGEACIIASSCAGGCPSGLVAHSDCSCWCPSCPPPKVPTDVNGPDCTCVCPPSAPCTAPQVVQANCSCGCLTSADTDQCQPPGQIENCTCVCPNVCPSQRIQTANCSCECPSTGTPLNCTSPQVVSEDCSSCVCLACSDPHFTADPNNDCACACVQPPPPSAINWAWNATFCLWDCPAVVNQLCTQAGYTYNDTLCACGPPATGHNKSNALVIGLGAGLGGAGFCLFAACAAYLIHKKKDSIKNLFSHHHTSDAGNVCDNPLHTPSGGHGDNALFTPK